MDETFWYINVFEPLHFVFKMIWLSMACGAISLVITKSALLNKFHAWLGKRSPFLEEMLSCPWCTSHWVSAALFFVYRPDLLYWATRPAWTSMYGLNWVLTPLDWLVNIMIMVALASVTVRFMHSTIKQLD